MADRYCHRTTKAILAQPVLARDGRMPTSGMVPKQRVVIWACLRAVAIAAR
jgi:hypothetical protein